MTIPQDPIPGRIIDALAATGLMTGAELAEACECSMLEVERALGDRWVRSCIDYMVQLSARGQEIADAAARASKKEIT